MHSLTVELCCIIQRWCMGRKKIRGKKCIKCTKHYKTHLYKFGSYIWISWNTLQSERRQRYFQVISYIILKHPNPIAPLPRNIQSLLGLFCSSALCLALPSADPDRLDFSKWASNCPWCLVFFCDEINLQWEQQLPPSMLCLSHSETVGPYSAAGGTALPCSCCSPTG